MNLGSDMQAPPPPFSKNRTGVTLALSGLLQQFFLTFLPSQEPQVGELRGKKEHKLNAIEHS